MRRVTIELSDDGKRLWVFPTDHDVTDELKPSECIDLGRYVPGTFPCQEVGAAVQRALMGKDGNS